MSNGLAIKIEEVREECFPVMKKNQKLRERTHYTLWDQKYPQFLRQTSIDCCSRHTVPKSQWHTEIGIFFFFFLMSQQIHWCSFVISQGHSQVWGSEGRWAGGGSWHDDSVSSCRTVHQVSAPHPVLRPRLKHSCSWVKPSHGNSKGTKAKSKHTRTHQSLACIPPLHSSPSKANHMAELLQGNVIQVYLVEPKRTAISQKN